MSVIKKAILFSALVILSLAEVQDDRNSTSRKQGSRQFEAVGNAFSFFRKLFRTVGPNGYYAPHHYEQKCPLCDSSVYSYCGERLLHDACCCTNSYDYELPYQCRVADCSFLHANSCREHKLIATCCCSDEYRSVLKSLRP